MLRALSYNAQAAGDTVEAKQVDSDTAQRGEETRVPPDAASILAQGHPSLFGGYQTLWCGAGFRPGATTSMPILGTIGTGRRAPHPGQALPDPVMVTDLVDWILRCE